MSPDPLLTIEQAAEFLNVSPWFFYNAVRRDRKTPAIPRVKIGRAVRYRLSTLNKFIEQNEVTPKTSGKEAQ